MSAFFFNASNKNDCSPKNLNNELALCTEGIYGSTFLLSIIADMVGREQSDIQKTPFNKHHTTYTAEKITTHRNILRMDLNC